MRNLEELVEKLENKHDKKSQVRILQEIGKLLLTEYIIQIGDLTIEPLLVEAYYYNNNFKDNSVHAAKESNANTYELARARQENNFDELYVHYGTKDGIDVVLSNGKYYLSFLIKNALINNKFAAQCKVSQMLCGNCDYNGKCNKGMNCKYYGTDILKHKDNIENTEIVFVRRKGLTNEYKDKPLAALPIYKIKDYAFTSGESKTNIVKNYIESQFKTESYDEEKLKELASGLIAWKKLKG
jgi:hypothetical protein